MVISLLHALMLHYSVSFKWVLWLLGRLSKRTLPARPAPGDECLFLLQVRVAAARHDVIIGFASAKECRWAYDVLITPEDDAMAGVLATMWDDAHAAAAARGALVGQADLGYLEQFDLSYMDEVRVPCTA